jgi:hypothetical protein
MLRIGSNVTLVFYAAHARTPHRAFVQETSLRYFAAAFALALAGCSTLAVERPRDFQAGPIWNQQDAERKCPVVAYAVSGHWNGQWVTTREGEMSVCGIVGSRRTGSLTEPTDIEAGPIWDQSDAEMKCPVVAVALDAEWTGQWVTTRWNEMSVCALRPHAP